MAFSALAVNAAALLNQFAWPISLERIGWHTYIVFVCWDAIQWAIFYFLLPETKKVCIPDRMGKVSLVFARSANEFCDTPENPRGA